MSLGRGASHRGSVSFLARAMVCLGSAAALVSCGGGGNDDLGAEGALASEGARMHALAVTPEQAALARWTPPINMSLVPVAGAVLPNGKLLFWAADSRTNFTTPGHTYSTLFDPATNTAVERDVTETQHDMFCPGTAQLPDGRLLVNGGLDNYSTSLYDPVNNTWSSAAKMNILRGYNSTVTLGDGSVLTMGGSWQPGYTYGGKTSELFTLAGGWRLLDGLPEDPFRLQSNVFVDWRSDSHFALLPTANGKVLLAGPTPDMAWVDPRGNGSWTVAGRRGDDVASFAGNWVMYDSGKILKTGGVDIHATHNANANAYVIDTTGGSANVRKLASMAYPRVYANSVVLPNGQVLVVGGQTVEQEFSDSNAVLAPELWDPQTETFTVMPPISVPRNYHSLALLLPDGRVVSAGGGLCDCVADHTDLQIMSPPYLFNADGSTAVRPVISSAPTEVTYGSKATVVTDGPVNAFSMVRLSATTHTVNNDQRRVALSFTVGANNAYQVDIPSNPGILLPGQWMLFAMNGQGTPSVAKIVTVNNTGAPLLQNAGDVSATMGRAVNVPIMATTTTGTLTFNASGLPAGLNIHATSGAITGVPTTAGHHVVTIKASNGSHTVSTDIVIDVTAAGTGKGLLGQYFNNTTASGWPVAQQNELPGLRAVGTLCAVEGGTCAVNGTQAVSYGANGVYASRSITGSVLCGNDVFGDPVPYIAKSCYVANAGTTAFSARWRGAIEPIASGATQFRALSNGGVRVWIDNQLVIDDWAAHPNGPITAAVNLVVGRRYPIWIDYRHQGAATAQMQLQWEPAGATAFSDLPAERLYASTPPSTTNIALGQPTSQSSLYGTGVPGLAVDGNTDGIFGNGSTTHTANTAAQDGWQVDLGRPSRVDMVQLWNRVDCCVSRLNNFMVFLSPADMSGRSLEQLKADPSVVKRQVGVSSIGPDISIPVRGVGRYVRVQLQGADFLSLAEVQVFGAPAVFHAPVMSPIANQQSVTGSTVDLGVQATDPDANPLTYSASGLPQGLTINASSGVISGIPSMAGGPVNVTVTASNGGGFSASTSFTWSIFGAVPQVVSLPAPVVAGGGTINYAPVLTAGAPSQYSWNFGDGSLDTAFNSGASTSHNFAAPGVYTVTLTIRTQDGRTTTQRFSQAVYAAGPSAMARASSSVLVEPRNAPLSSRLWVVNADNDSVSVFDTANNTRLAEIAVGTAPRSLALASDGRIWVTNQKGASISIISPSSLSVVQTLALPRASQPFGILVSPVDGNIFVVLEATGQLLKLQGTTGASLGTLAVGSRPRHLAMSATGDALFVSRFITPPLPGEGTVKVSTTSGSGARLGGEVLSVDPSTLAIKRTIVLAHSERNDAENQGRGIPNYLGAMAIAPNGKSGWVPSKQDNIKRGPLRDGNELNFQNTVRAVSSRIDLISGNEDLAARIDHDNAGMASAAVYHPTGAYLFVALETNRQVAVVDVAGQRELFRYEVGMAPQGLAISADGLKLYVNNFMGRSVSVIDLLPLVGFGQTMAQTVATLGAVGTDKLAPAVLKGKQFFYDARDSRLSRDSYMSCASCHNDGGHDGRVWDMTGLGQGLRNTIDLRGRAGTGQGFMHWSANFDEVQDFEAQIRTLSGGVGLMTPTDFNTGTRSQALGTPKAGVSADLDALAAYVQSLRSFDPSPYRRADATLTAAAQAGKTVFANRNCVSCHSGADFTGSGNPSQLKNIGTLKPSSGASLSGIDIPTLRDVWNTAPYLHDGSALTLADAVTAHNSSAIGATPLSPTELSDLTAYLQQIGGEEPSPSAWTVCASENGTCTLPAGLVADVYFGANGSYAMKSGRSGSVACSLSTFGLDPARGTVKSCFYAPTANLALTPCAADGATCSPPSGTSGNVYYGANGSFSVRTGITGIVCSTAAFGNPNAGAPMSCGYVATPASPVPVPALTTCANEGGVCALPAGMTADVYYGANGKYTLRTGLTGNVNCGEGTFGDPTPYLAKQCKYTVSGSMARVACSADNAFCSLPAGASGDVYYGGDGKFSVRSGVSGVFCSDLAFGGDPNPGRPKTCTYLRSPG